MTDVQDFMDKAWLINSGRRKLIHRKNPLLSDLPDWVENWHDEQRAAIREIKAAFDDGIKVVVLDAPTGIGKTLIGETVRRMLDSRGLYVCTTKSLQDQFVRDFQYAKVIKGRGNYPTELYPGRFKPEKGWSDMHLSCDDCTADGSNEPGACDWCSVKSQCPYEVAKVAARRAQVAVLNTSYFLAEVNRATQPDKPPAFTNWPMVIFDECDTLEGELMSHVSVEVSERRIDRYSLGSIKATVESDWKRWIGESVPKLTEVRRELRRSGDIRDQREVRGLDRLIDGLTAVGQGLESDDSPWVFTGRDGKVSFKPAKVDKFGADYIWRHSDRFLLMSATVISATEMMSSLGFNEKIKWVRLPSPFDVERRKVIVRPAADMTSSKGANNGQRGVRPGEYDKLVEAIKRICEDHERDNILIHCVSYDLGGKLSASLRGLGRRVETYREAADRARVVEILHTEGKRGGGVVVIAPSLDRGIDLPGDAARVQIIAKCPYPYLGDRQIAARLYSGGGRTWYNVQTVRTIVQMCGRAVRNREDYAVTYIVDSSFKNKLWNSARNLFPMWWTEAVKWERPW